MKALALFSGGLDSIIACDLIKKQKIEVIALNFVSYFFGGDLKAKSSADELGIELKYINIKEEQKNIVYNPLNGYGKNMNPCIDCHGLMLKKAKELLEYYGAKFIITGEVLEQRPMSQNYSALKRVEKIGDVAGMVVRPLSAKHLEITIPEEQGWIDREKLLNIQGRSRKFQFEYVEKISMKKFPTPGGGCLLTEQSYSRRLKILKDENIFKDPYFEIIKHSRFLRIEAQKYIFIGRNKDENQILERYKNLGYVVKGGKTPGPYILGVGELNDIEKKLIKDLFSFYSKVKGEEEVYLSENSKIIEHPKILDFLKLKDKIKNYLIK